MKTRMPRRTFLAAGAAEPRPPEGSQKTEPPAALRHRARHLCDAESAGLNGGRLSRPSGRLAVPDNEGRRAEEAQRQSRPLETSPTTISVSSVHVRAPEVLHKMNPGKGLTFL